jgi:TrmH RNA methyltransferase
VYGLRAGLAVLAVRPHDVLTIACSPRVVPELGASLRAAEDRGVAVAELPDRDLEQLAASPHHEGLVITTRPRAWASPRQLAELLVAQRGTAVALDRVRNPYNIGAILRSAAFFGVDAALLGALAPTPDLAPNAVRVAEGGAERVVLCRTPDLGETLARLKGRGVRIIGSEARAKQPAFGHRFARPCVVVVGHEREGMTERVRAQCDELVAIPGTGAMDSLNVSVATGVLIAELMRA